MDEVSHYAKGNKGVTERQKLRIHMHEELKNIMLTDAERLVFTWRIRVDDGEILGQG